MADNMTQSGKKHKKPGQPFDKNHSDHPDYTSDNPGDVATVSAAVDPQATPATTPITPITMPITNSPYAAELSSKLAA